MARIEGAPAQVFAPFLEPEGSPKTLPDVPHAPRRWRRHRPCRLHGMGRRVRRCRGSCRFRASPPRALRGRVPSLYSAIKAKPGARVANAQLGRRRARFSTGFRVQASQVYSAMAECCPDPKSGLSKAMRCNDSRGRTCPRVLVKAINQLRASKRLLASTTNCAMRKGRSRHRYGIVR
jgi:hypothetical protein